MTDRSWAVWFNGAHCEAPHCESWSIFPQEHGFLVVLWGDSHIVYCSTDCLLKGIAARSSPMETFDVP